MIPFQELSGKVVADIAAVLRRVDEAAVARLVERLGTERRVFMCASGRSGAMLRAMAIRLSHLGIETHILGEGACPPLRKGDLVLAGSGSGRTPVPLKQLAAARSAGASVVLMTADPCSAMAELSDEIVQIPAPVTPTDGTPHTLRSLFEECLLVVCDCACRMLQERLGFSAADMQSRHSKEE